MPPAPGARPSPTPQRPARSRPLPPQALARRSHCFFLNVTASSLISKWLGDSNKLIRAVFTLAHKLQPCIIFIGAGGRAR